MEKIYLLALPLAGMLACAPSSTETARALTHQGPVTLDSGIAADDAGTGPNTSCWASVCDDGGMGPCPLDAGTPCTFSGDFCTTGTCDGNGNCSNTTVTMCPPDGGTDQCLACDGLGHCVNANEGIACQDFATCMSGTCSQGVCDAGMSTCLPPDQCQISNNCSNGTCVPQNKQPGTPCTNSGDPCNSYSCDGSGNCNPSTSLCTAATICHPLNGCDMSCTDGGCNPCVYGDAPQFTDCPLPDGGAGLCDGVGNCVTPDAGSDGGGTVMDAGSDAGDGGGTGEDGGGTVNGGGDAGNSGGPHNPFECGCGAGPGAPVLLALGLLAAFLGRRRREGKDHV